MASIPDTIKVVPLFLLLGYNAASSMSKLQLKRLVSLLHGKHLSEYLPINYYLNIIQLGNLTSEAAIERAPEYAQNQPAALPTRNRRSATKEQKTPTNMARRYRNQGTEDTCKYG